MVEQPANGSAAFERGEIELRSNGEACAAWLYRPTTSVDRVPIVILAHGFGMVKEAGLDRYAERFAAAGFAALVFDYRHFGASGGSPRELLDVDRQLDDWRAAMACARSLEGVDPDLVALWGTSFSGGHVVRLATEDPRIRTVVSQVPFSGTGERRGPPRPAFMARLIWAALRDELAGRLGRGPAYLPITAPEGEPCLFERSGGRDPLAELFASEEHRREHWQNRFTPRVILRLPGYKPFERVEGLRRPWMLCLADRDEITPADRAAERAAPSEGLVLRRYPTDHFGIYAGEWFERAIAEQVEFLREQLVYPSDEEASAGETLP